MSGKEQGFEESLEKLESIVDNIESGDLSLDESIVKYEEGMKLSKFCTSKLNDIQRKVEILVKDSSGEIETKPFDEPKEEKILKLKKKTSKKKPTKGEEYLF